MSLPPWIAPDARGRDACYWNAVAVAALARLRVISERREHIRHFTGCAWYDWHEHCTCGLDELLADLLPGGE